jgi:hypothetical protein
LFAVVVVAGIESKVGAEEVVVGIESKVGAEEVVGGVTVTGAVESVDSVVGNSEVLVSVGKLLTTVNGTT